MSSIIFKNLSDICAQDTDKYGPKAAMLGELIKGGFNVPHGYAVPVQSFDSFLQKNNFPYKPSDYTAYSTEIRKCLKSYSFDQEFRGSLSLCILNMNQKYPNDQIIVRTSALCEDNMVSSMAGVFTSFPGLKTKEEVEEAVKECYISLFSDNVLNNYASGMIGAETLKAGVIIQRYVKGDISGVTFTADTIKMAPDTIKISSVYGLCSGLTSGSEYVTTYTCDKNSLEVKNIYGKQQILADDKLLLLLSSAKEIEKLAGYYQDIEWTFSDDALYILQTRAITNYKDIEFPKDWKAENNKYANNEWALSNDKCFMPLIGELISESNNCSGSGAYNYGMEWDSEIYMMQNGYMYKSKREIPNGKERLDAFFKKINSQFDNGEDEFDKYIKPELSSLIENMHYKYINKNLLNEELISYLNDALFYLRRSTALHWRATTSEWYLGHFFRKKIAKFFDKISSQDLIDLVYSKTMMVTEREEIYKIVKHIQENADLMELFSVYKFDSIIEARLGRMRNEAALRLLELIKEYSSKYGWFYCWNFENGLSKVGAISIRDSINKIRRYLHIDIDEYYMNIRNITDNADRLKEIGYSRCLMPEDKTIFDTAVKAGEKAFLAGDDHAYYICSRKFVYICDSLMKIANALVKNNIINNIYDIHFLYVDEIKDLLINKRSVQYVISKRKETYALQKRMLPPEYLGKKSSKDLKTDSNNSTDITTRFIKGESGSKKTVQGRIHINFPKQPTDSDIILLLEHGHEGDLTTILGQVKGIILKMGTPACHMGIIARELNIPAIYGVGTQANILKNGDKVEIRGETGEVVLLDQ